MINMVNYSGGKDSTAMVLKMLENNMRVDKLVFFDMGLDYPEVEDHHIKFEKYTGLKITRLYLKRNFEYWLSEHTSKKGKYPEKCGNGWPNMLNRWCTGLKIQAMKRFTAGLNGPVLKHIGIASDEKVRAKPRQGELIRYPLIEWNMTEADCLQLCYDAGFDWDGLYHKINRISCWACPLARISQLRVIYNDYPQLWKKLEYWESITWNSFRLSGETVYDMAKRFEKEKEKQAIDKLI